MPYPIVSSEIQNATPPLAPLPPDTSQPPIHGPSNPQATDAYIQAIGDINRALGLGRNVDVTV